MAQQRPYRILDVFVRDRAGRLIPGVEINFALNGVPPRSVDGSEGRGRIESPAANSGPVDVTVSYKGVEKRARIAGGQASYEFRYDTNVGPEGGHIALWVGCGLVALSVVLAFVFNNQNAIQLKIIQGLFALGLGGFATELTGFLNVDMDFGKRLTIGAGGAFAVFVILWFTDAKL